MSMLVMVVDEDMQRSIEFGHPICDVMNIIPRIILEVDKRDYPLLGGIDRYSNTLFNQRQCLALLEEWGRVTDQMSNPEFSLFLEQIRRLISVCLEEPHRYLMFVGD